MNREREREREGGEEGSKKNREEKKKFVAVRITINLQGENGRRRKVQRCGSSTYWA